MSREWETRKLDLVHKQSCSERRPAVQLLFFGCFFDLKTPYHQHHTDEDFFFSIAPWPPLPSAAQICLCLPCMLGGLRLEL